MAGRVQYICPCGIREYGRKSTQSMKMAGCVQFMCPSGIQNKSDSMNENDWLGLMYMSMWNTEENRLNE